MEGGVQTKVSAVRNSLETGNRAKDVMAEYESPSARPGGNGLQGSGPGSQGGEMAARV